MPLPARTPRREDTFNVLDPSGKCQTGGVCGYSAAMAREEGRSAGRRQRTASAEAPSGPVPELLRRVLSLGLSGFVLTESALRRALGETLPRDWIDFLVDQSERTRSELLDRISFEVASSLEKVDLASVARQLLEGRRLELRVELRLKDDSDAAREPERASAPRGRRKPPGAEPA